MSTRRRVYSGLEGWLMSGEVLYCGLVTLTEDYKVTNYVDYGAKITISNLSKYTSGDYLILINVSVYDHSSNEGKFSSDFGNLVMNPVNNEIVDNLSGTDSYYRFDYVAYGNDYIHVGSDTGRNNAYNLIILAIPRTDV